jgi:hypothetical protein
MPIHDNEAFNEFLTSMTLRQPESDADFECFEVVPSRFLSDLSVHVSSEPIYLWYWKGCTLAPNTMVAQGASTDRARFNFRNGTSDACDAVPHFLYPWISSRAIKHNPWNDRARRVISVLDLTVPSVPRHGYVSPWAFY